MHRQPRQKRTPRIRHRHRRKLPNEQHNPMLYPGRILVPQNHAAHALDLCVGERGVELVARGQVVEDGFRLDAGGDGEDGADEGCVPECVGEPEAVWGCFVGPGDGGEDSAAAEGCLGIVFSGGKVDDEDVSII